jgi:murein DD-endopeptidase MepM/ murein hydrolase activator NlpD
LIPLLIFVLASAGQAAERSGDSEPPHLPEVWVPFECGHSYPVSQAHGAGSHLANDTWAWDFRMPTGVPIVAAQDGTVRVVRGDSHTGGCDPRYAPDANYVVISHAGGLETQYLHLESVRVKPGDGVKAGDLLGSSGTTGWACGSHLHFKVARSEGSGWNNPSVPARIKGYGDPQTDTLVTSKACDVKAAVAAASEAVKDGGEVHPGSVSSGQVELVSSVARKAGEREGEALNKQLSQENTANGAAAPAHKPAAPQQPDRSSSGGSAPKP